METADDYIERTVDNIEKPTCDPHHYRGLVLKNGLTVLLVSDPNVKVSAACLSIAVGSLSNPDGLAGLANLCSNLLSLGTQKYPDPHGFENFLTQNFGTFYTLTGNDYTNFNFSVQVNALEEALDRFAQFFLNPLFSKSATLRQIMKICSEHEQNINMDSKRIDQMIRNGADPNHPIHDTYGTGSRYTLLDGPLLKKIDIHEKVKEFIFKWYSSHLMYLTVLGKEDLHTLKEMVIPVFGKIQKKNVDMPYWNEPIYKAEQLATKTVVVPLRDIIELHITFPIPDVTKHYKSRPTWYLSILFQNNGPNSILGILKNKGWSTDLIARKHKEARGIELYRIKVCLTKEGLEHTDDIIKLIFQCVNMLKYKRQPQKWFYEEYKNSCTMKYKFQEKIPSSEYVNQLSQNMIVVKLEDILTATQNIVQEWKPNLITDFLSYLRPDNMRITVVSKIFVNMTNTVDKFFGTRYATSKIPAETLKMWQEDNLSQDLRMPPRNEFITTISSLVNVSEEEPATPQVCYESSRLKCWLKKDTQFRLPKSFVTVFFSRISIRNELEQFAISLLFLELIKDDFAYFIKDASRANLYMTFGLNSFGFQVNFDGFDQKLQVLLKQFIDKLATFKIDPMHFTLIKENKTEEWGNNDDATSYKVAMYHQMVVLRRAWTHEQLKDAAQNVTIGQVEEYIKTFMTHTYINLLVYGNVDDKKALKMVEILEKPFLSQGAVAFPFPKSDETNLVFKNNNRRIFLDVKNDFLSNSSSCLMFYCGTYSTKKAAIINLFNMITRNRFCRCMKIHLHARLQHNCTVTSSFRVYGDAMFLTYVVQSKHSPRLITHKIEEFLVNISTWLVSLSENLFDTYKTILGNNLLRKPSSMLEQMNIYRYEFIQWTFDFNRAQKEADALRLVSKQEILRFYRKFIKQMDIERCKYTIQVQKNRRNV